MSTEWSVMMLQIPDCLGQEMVSVRSGFAVASLRTEGKTPADVTAGSI